MAKRNWGVAALFSGIALGLFVVFTGIFALGCDPSCLIVGSMYPSTWTSIFVWIPLTLILAPVLFFVGLGLLEKAF